jgi:hypothetical protein
MQSISTIVPEHFHGIDWTNCCNRTEAAAAGPWSMMSTPTFVSSPSEKMSPDTVSTTAGCPNAQLPNWNCCEHKHAFGAQSAERQCCGVVENNMRLIGW